MFESISYEVIFMHSNKYNVCDINSQSSKLVMENASGQKNSLHFLKDGVVDIS